MSSHKNMKNEIVIPNPIKKKYKSGLDMSQFEHIPGISQYNHNYYKGFDNDLLYAESDDDQITEYYLVNKTGVLDFKYIGYIFGDEILIVK